MTLIVQKSVSHFLGSKHVLYIVLHKFVRCYCVFFYQFYNSTRLAWACRFSVFYGPYCINPLAITSYSVISDPISSKPIIYNCVNVKSNHPPVVLLCSSVMFLISLQCLIIILPLWAKNIVGGLFSYNPANLFPFCVLILKLSKFASGSLFIRICFCRTLLLRVIFFTEFLSVLFCISRLVLSIRVWSLMTHMLLDRSMVILLHFYICLSRNNRFDFSHYLLSHSVDIFT